MKSLTQAPSSIRKMLRYAGLLYAGLSLLSTLCYCSCTSGTFYTLSTGEYMLEQRLDRQFIISTECSYPPEANQSVSIPVYQVGNKYYVAAERVTTRTKRSILATVGSAPETHYINQYDDGEKKYYEVERADSAGAPCFFVPSEKKETSLPSVTSMQDEIHPAGTSTSGVPTFICRRDARAAMPQLESLPDAELPHTLAHLRGAPSLTTGKDGSPQLMLTEVHESLSWRSLYAVPAAAVLFVAVDIPFDIISFTGFCIRSIFD